MPLFGPKRPPPFEAFKLKTYLKCGIARIKITRAKKDNEAKIMAKEIGALLAQGVGKEEMARIKVEHVIRNKNDAHALEIVELFCDLLLARMMLVEGEKESCPIELQEAVFSLCWAAERTEVVELRDAKQQFMLHWPRQFGLDPFMQPLQALTQDGRVSTGATPVSNPRETAVNKKLKEYLGITVPPADKVIEYLETIASIYAPEWECPDWLREADSNLIDVEHSHLNRPGEFEPGYNAAPLQAVPFIPGGAAGMADFDTMFPAPPSNHPGGGPPPPFNGGGGGGGGGGGMGIPAVVVPPPGYGPPAGQAPPPGYGMEPPPYGMPDPKGDALQAKLAQGGEPVPPPAFQPPPADFDALEARFRAMQGGAPPAAGDPPPGYLSPTAPPQVTAFAAAPVPAPAPAPEPEPGPGLSDLEARFASLTAAGGGASAPPPVFAPAPAPLNMSLSRLPGEAIDDFELRLGAIAAASQAPPSFGLDDLPSPPGGLPKPPGGGGGGGQVSADIFDSFPSVPASDADGFPSIPGHHPVDGDLFPSVPGAASQPTGGMSDLEARFAALQRGNRND